MARTRLSVADILHRGVVLSLVGVCVWGIGTGILVHRDTVRMGRDHRSARGRRPANGRGPCEESSRGERAALGRSSAGGPSRAKFQKPGGCVLLAALTNLQFIPSTVQGTSHKWTVSPLK
ncbi:hypothetical protein F5148DRAFT_849695 [Russula earlei]|uniref:Uncharacterized protein n=1 Tax=Russula earlei TaxID=71964 RepID=A0ACC0ULQ8_9AGAM|nr:hypothetical protein F5148DRAFT_849695 [Russula earlei]